MAVISSEEYDLRPLIYSNPFHEVNPKYTICITHFTNRDKLNTFFTHLFFTNYKWTITNDNMDFQITKEYNHQIEYW